jgi:hypothetical protein
MDSARISSPIWLSKNELRFNSIVGALGLLLILLTRTGIAPVREHLFPEHLKWLIANLIFFNTLHVAFTLVLLRTSDEFSLRLKRASLKQKTLVPFLCLISVGTLIFFLSQRLLPHGTLAVALFMGVIPQFHILAQHKGLCLNMMGHSRWRERVKLGWRYAIYFLLTVSILLIWRGQHDWRVTAAWVAAVVFGALTVLSWLALYESGVKTPSPYLFQLKLLMFPFTLVSDLAAFIVISLHGIEYISVVSSLVSYRKLKEDWRSLGLILAFTIFVSVVSWIASLEGYWTNGGLIANAILMATVVVHYGLDGVIFRSAQFYATPELGASTSSQPLRVSG